MRQGYTCPGLILRQTANVIFRRFPFLPLLFSMRQNDFERYAEQSQQFMTTGGTGSKIERKHRYNLIVRQTDGGSYASAGITTAKARR
ncbi:hypothetical protein D3C76_1536180 [compost metagenome]